MRPGDVPLVSQVFEWGAEDRVFDALLLVGPLVVVIVVVLGRSALTRAIALVYIATFVAYALYRGTS